MQYLFQGIWKKFGPVRRFAKELLKTPFFLKKMTHWGNPIVSKIL